MRRDTCDYLLPGGVRLSPVGLFLLVSLLMGIATACTSGVPAPTATANPTETETPVPSRTPTITQVPTATPTLTATPTVTLTPSVTPTASNTAPPTATPWPTIAFAGDRWTMAEVAAPLGAPLTEPWISYVNINDRDGIGDPRTPSPETNVQTVYIVNPRTGQQIPVLSMPASTDDRVYWASAGERLAYFLDDEADPTATGLYVFDLTIGVGSRVLRMDSLTPRGFFSPPRWSPDGTQIAIAAQTEYDIEVYVLNPDGTKLRNITQSGAFDVWPSWSPDGRFVAFVSDRAECPSWRPGDGCLEANPNGATGGHLYALDMETGETRRLSEEWITEPPYWINDNLIGFATGSFVLGDDFRAIWQADVSTGESTRIVLQDAPDLAYYLAESWTSDGQRVLFQRAGETTDIAQMTSGGAFVSGADQFNFARFAFAAGWAPDGSRVAFGGRNGQCPYGLVVMTSDFRIISNANPPPTACDPVFSPDGNWIAYAGINPRIDGRLDLYVANANGYSAVNHSATLRGQIRVLGWIGAVVP